MGQLSPFRYKGFIKYNSLNDTTLKEGSTSEKYKEKPFNIIYFILSELRNKELYLYP